MCTDENKALSRRFFAESDQQQFDAAWDLLAPDYVAHAPGAPGPLDRAAFRQFAGLFYAAFPDGHHVIEDQVADGDKVVSRLTWRGTQQGTFQGLPPTGRQIAMTGIALHRIAQGKIAAAWIEFDTFGLLQQLGAMPQPEPAHA